MYRGICNLWYLLIMDSVAGQGVSATDRFGVRKRDRQRGSMGSPFCRSVSWAGNVMSPVVKNTSLTR